MPELRPSKLFIVESVSLGCMAALCIFCGRMANSKEDLWPRWLIKSVLLDRPSKIEMEFAIRPSKSFTKKYVTSRCVCKTCNEGWMSNLETDTKPILEPLIFDS